MSELLIVNNRNGTKTYVTRGSAVAVIRVGGNAASVESKTAQAGSSSVDIINACARHAAAVLGNRVEAAEKVVETFKVEAPVETVVTTVPETTLVETIEKPVIELPEEPVSVETDEEPAPTSDSSMQISAEEEVRNERLQMLRELAIGIGYNLSEDQARDLSVCPDYTDEWALESLRKLKTETSVPIDTETPVAGGNNEASDELSRGRADFRERTGETKRELISKIARQVGYEPTEEQVAYILSWAEFSGKAVRGLLVFEKTLADLRAACEAAGTRAFNGRNLTRMIISRQNTGHPIMIEQMVAVIKECDGILGDIEAKFALDKSDGIVAEAQTDQIADDTVTVQAEDQTAPVNQSLAEDDAVQDVINQLADAGINSVNELLTVASNTDELKSFLEEYDLDEKAIQDLAAILFPIGKKEEEKQEPVAGSTEPPANNEESIVSSPLEMGLKLGLERDDAEFLEKAGLSPHGFLDATGRNKDRGRVQQNLGLRKAEVLALRRRIQQALDSAEQAGETA